MLTRIEHLLTTLGEEGAEVSQRCSKAMRFGLLEVQPGQIFANRDRIRQEFHDLYAVYGMLVQEGIFPPGIDANMVEAKRLKVEKFIEYAREQGTVE